MTSPRPVRRFGALGFTLIEVMIAASILSIAILGLIQTFQFITVSIQSQKARTLANNLAQEKIEVLKNYSYYRLLVTTTPYVDTRFNPNLLYDDTTGNYPYESLTVSGVAFRRGTRVDFASLVNGSVSTMSWTSLDNGLKQITVYVIYTDRGTTRYVQLTNLLENPYVNPLDSSMSGTVTKASGGGAVAGALVKVLENSNWQATTDASGSYSFSVYHGSYTVQASSGGYYTSASGLTVVSRGTNATVNFTLSKISSGTFTGTAWKQDHLVLSSVVASSNNNVGCDQEWVSVYNPTTYTWTMAGATGTASPTIGLKYQHRSSDSQQTITVNYRTLTIAPGSYYLFANTGTVVAVGISRTADATWDTTTYGSCYDMLQYRTSGGVMLYSVSSGGAIDQVGWNSNNSSLNAPFYEGTAIGSAQGLGANESFTRMSSTAGVDANYGRCYDEDNNTTDFADVSPIAALHNSGDSKTCISGTPLYGAMVSAGDGLSSSTQTYKSGSPPVAQFTLTNVATGTWTVEIDSGTLIDQLTNATIVTPGTTVVLPSTSTSPGLVSGYSVAFTTAVNTNGFVSGYVTDIYGGALSGIQVRAGGTTVTTSANGYYYVSSSTGDVVVIANPSNANSLYTASQSILVIYQGLITSQWFTLAQGGSVKGYVTSGPSPLPNITVTAQIGGSVAGSGVSDTSGYFYIYNLSTGTYTITPDLDPASAASPASLSSSVVVNQVLNVGTITVTGAFGTLKGNVLDSGGATITTGVLILTSTGTIPTSPPTIYASSAAAQQVYYMAASLSDGTYSMLVRGSTYYNYNLTAFYPIASATGSGITISTKTYTGISISPGGSTSNDIHF